MVDFKLKRWWAGHESPIGPATWSVSKMKIEGKSMQTRLWTVIYVISSTSRDFKDDFPFFSQVEYVIVPCRVYVVIIWWY